MHSDPIDSVLNCVTKTTPGPWQANDKSVVSEKINDYGNFIVFSIERELTPQDEANLRLIAATPDLLKILKEVSAYLWGEAQERKLDEPETNLHRQIKDVLVKAGCQ